MRAALSPLRRPTAEPTAPASASQKDAASATASELSCRRYKSRTARRKRASGQAKVTSSARRSAPRRSAQSSALIVPGARRRGATHSVSVLERLLAHKATLSRHAIDATSNKDEYKHLYKPAFAPQGGIISESQNHPDRRPSSTPAPKPPPEGPLNSRTCMAWPYRSCASFESTLPSLFASSTCVNLREILAWSTVT